MREGIAPGGGRAVGWMDEWMRRGRMALMCAPGKQQNGGGNLYFNALPPLSTTTNKTQGRRTVESTQLATRNNTPYRITPANNHPPTILYNNGNESSFFLLLAFTGVGGEIL